MNRPLIKKIRPCTFEPNCQGWESIAGKWRTVGWPRRPNASELSKMVPIVESTNGYPVGIFGATPELRDLSAKCKPKNEVFLFEKSEISYHAMTDILKKDFKASPKKEFLVHIDWELLDFEKNSFSLLMGDIMTGYMQTVPRLERFLYNCYQMLQVGGKFILRDFVNTPFNASIKEIRHSKLSTDEKRWAYILKPNFAIEGKTFYEEKLAQNLLKAGDVKVFKTCANPPRDRLMPDQKDFEALVAKSKFNVSIICPPQCNGKASPGLWVLEKKG
ncbi:MAG: hypothetical protein WC492_00485 [Candidatus Micrarchaeia archaeon]